MYRKQYRIVSVRNAVLYSGLSLDQANAIANQMLGLVFIESYLALSC